MAPVRLQNFERWLRSASRCAGPGRDLLLSLLLVAFYALLLPGPAQARHSRRLAGRIDAILESHSVGRGFWGIEVVRLSDGKVLYARNAGHLFEPASTMKLFTAAAALTRLGPDFIFRTTVESSSLPDAEGRVPDLVLVGRGDANLGSHVLPYRLKTQFRPPADRAFEELAEQVAAKGVREVTGDIVADDSYYVDQPYGPDWAIDDMVWGYGAPITALAFNDNSLSLRIQPGSPKGAAAKISLEPVADYYSVKNEVRTTVADIPAKVHVDRAPGSTELRVRGHVPAGSGEIKEDVAIRNPPQLIGRMFRRLLEQRGVKVDGPVVVREQNPDGVVVAGPGPGAGGARNILAEHDSLPLREDIKVTLKVSQNLHAEMLLRTLARKLAGQGNPEAGVKILDDLARELDIPRDEVYFAGGSGLSRDTLVSPDALIKLLEFMARSENFKDFLDALPVAGVDGTLAGRFINSAAKGHIYAKTGSMEHVNALAGYMDPSGGERLAFVIIVNSHPADSASAIRLLDRIALAIYRRFAAGRKLR